MVTIIICKKDTQPSQTCSEGHTFLLLNSQGCFFFLRALQRKTKAIPSKRFLRHTPECRSLELVPARVVLSASLASVPLGFVLAISPISTSDFSDSR